MGNLSVQPERSRVRWGIVGAGRVARGFADDLCRLPDAELVAVASRRRHHADEFASRFDSVSVYDTYEELVRDADVDVVYVATPNHRHAQDSLLCLRHGKAVLCEKPFAMNHAEAQEVVAEARRRGLFCMEAMWMRFVPAIRRTVELVESGAIGRIVSIHADFSMDAPYDPAGRLFDPDLGGGATLDLGVYAVSLIDLLVGAPSDVVSRATVGRTLVAEQTTAVLVHADGCLATVSAGLLAPGPNRAVIAGTAGTISLPGPICAPRSLRIELHPEPSSADRSDDGPLASIRRRIERTRAWSIVAGPAAHVVRRLHTRAGAERHPIEGNGYGYEAAEVIRCLRAGALESPLNPLDDTLRVMETMDKIRRSWPPLVAGESPN